MLTIREEQMRALASAAQERALTDAVWMLRQSSDQLGRTFSNEELRTLAEYGMVKALSFGFASDDELLRFLHLMVKHGRHIDQLAVPGHLLRKSGMSGEEKLQALEAWDKDLPAAIDRS
jgi:hypothetical protein